MLTRIDFKEIYRSFECNLDKDFFIPCYQESVLLERGAGFFTLGSLILDIDGIIQFLDNNGEIHLVCNPKLSEEDINLIIAGQSLDKERITKSLLRELSNGSDFSESEISALDVICNMICDKRLIIKIAYMPKGGIYHEKIGLFSDINENKVYFSGSANETVGAKRYNAECIEVALSWEGGKKKIDSQQEYFNKLWNNEYGEIIQVMDFPEAVEREILEKYKKSDSLAQAIDSYRKSKSGNAPKKKSLRPYQKNAIEEFVENGFAHFYEMATGTGKTYTAVKTVERAIKEKGNLFVLVCVPQTDLQKQWQDEFENAGWKDIFLLGGLAAGKSEENFSTAVIEYSGNKKNVVCIAVNDTFFGKYSERLEFIDKIFFIADEAHNITASAFDRIPKHAICKLGLSATLERFGQGEADAIKDFFTNGRNVTFYYGIEEAIDKGYLSHYRYYPIIVRLNEEETERYRAKSKALAVEMSSADRDMGKIERLKIERRLILKQAAEKLPKLEEMTSNYPFKNSVVYCGQGKSEEEPIIDKVTQILNKSGLTVSQFTSKTVDRVKVLEKFEQNYFDVLVAIKCFDEGVDVPKLDKIYIMASDCSLRQTVQRRGRVLRICAETGKTEASIYDMVVLPLKSDNSSSASSVVRSEFIRVVEYNRLADNRDDNQIEIEKIMKKYGITQEDLNNEDRFQGA